MKTVWLGLILLGLAAGVPAQDDGARKVTARQRQAIVDSVAQAVDSIYVFPDVGRKMAELIRAQSQRGAYDTLSSLPQFTRVLTDDLQSVSHDKHMSVGPLSEEQLQAVDQAAVDSLHREDMRYYNYGFRELSRLPGNIGYIKLNQFAPAEVAGATAIAALNFVGNSDALIFDLRGNGGGDPSMIQLISSYLFAEPTHLNDFFLRADSSTQQFWTQANVPGKKLTEIPVYVLISPNTFSAAEEFTYNLKNLKRATIVGQTSGGGAHPNQFIRFASLGVELSVAFGRAVNPITQTNWEGSGVAPDLECEPDDALLTARLDALKVLRDRVRSESRRFEFEWQMEGINAELHPYVPQEGELDRYAGSYGPRSVKLENGVLLYRRDQNPYKRLIPLAPNRFQLEGVDYFRVVFVLDGAGTPVEFEGHYDNGMIDRNRRDG